jgi:hypothetical protein
MDDVKPKAVTFSIVSAASKVKKEADDLNVAFASLSALVGQRIEVEGWWRPADAKQKDALPSLAVTRGTAEKK